MKEQVWDANGGDSDITALILSNSLRASEDKIRKANENTVLPDMFPSRRECSGEKSVSGHNKQKLVHLYTSQSEKIRNVPWIYEKILGIPRKGPPQESEERCFFSFYDEKHKKSSICFFKALKRILHL